MWLLLQCKEEFVDVESEPRVVGSWREWPQGNRFHLKFQDDKVLFKP